MKLEKREIKTYKVKKSIYEKAMSESKKKKKYLATDIEKFVINVAEGNIIIYKNK